MAISEPKQNHLSNNQAGNYEIGAPVDDSYCRSDNVDDLNNLSIKLNIVCRLLEDGFQDDGLRIAKAARNDLKDILGASRANSDTH